MVVEIDVKTLLFCLGVFFILCAVAVPVLVHGPLNPGD